MELLSWFASKLSFRILLLPFLLLQIPSEIGQLTYLESFSIGRNALTGSLPTELGLLDGLFEIGVSSNQLSGFVSDKLAVV